MHGPFPFLTDISVAVHAVSSCYGKLCTETELNYFRHILAETITSLGYGLQYQRRLTKGIEDFGFIIIFIQHY